MTDSISIVVFSRELLFVDASSWSHISSFGRFGILMFRVLTMFGGVGFNNEFLDVHLPLFFKIVIEDK